jgi:hypothetical protein
MSAIAMDPLSSTCAAWPTGLAFIPLDALLFAEKVAAASVTSTESDPARSGSACGQIVDTRIGETATDPPAAVE